MVPPVPPLFQALSERLVSNKTAGFDVVPDAVLVNEYDPGQGIAFHVDDIKVVGAMVASVSLGSPAVIDFAIVKHKKPNAVVAAEVHAKAGGAAAAGSAVADTKTKPDGKSPSTGAGTRSGGASGGKDAAADSSTGTAPAASASGKRESQSVLLEPNSALIMFGTARYDYKHGITKSLTDNWRGKVLERTRRISLTFRYAPSKNITTKQ